MSAGALRELIAPARRLAFVGLAKNTGKTEALNCALRELHREGCCVGVTSVGRDGESHDAIDARIEKPRVRLPKGSLVASSDLLLRAAGAAHELLADTHLRTPLGRVMIARMLAAGDVQVAGPSAAEHVRAVTDAMLSHGAEHVLIDGAFDRRAASSPAVSNGLVMSTGAVLHEDPEEVVARTVEAVELAQLPLQEDEPTRRLAARAHASMLVGEPDRPALALRPRFALTSSAGELRELLAANPRARRLIVHGALCAGLLDDLAQALRGRELELTVADSTRVFLDGRGCGWYERRGISLRVLARTRLRALTVNPVAPRSHRFDSRRLRERLQQRIPDVPVLDVREGADELVAA